jgi:hypothetical protein
LEGKNANRENRKPKNMKKKERKRKCREKTGVKMEKYMHEGRKTVTAVSLIGRGGYGFKFKIYEQIR